MAATRVTTMPTATDHTVRTRALVAAVLGVLVLLATVMLADVGGVFLVAAFGIPGLVLVVRRPHQVIAWLLLLMALGLALGTTRVTATVDDLVASTTSPLEAFTAWANGTGWVLVFQGLIGITLVFPSGRMPAGRWRVVGRVVVALSAVLAVILLFGPIINVTLSDYQSGIDVPNPYALPFVAGSRTLIAATVPLWFALFLVAGVGGASLVARFRASDGLERLQYRWLAWALVLVGIGSVTWAIVTNVLQLDAGLLPAIIIAVTYPMIPIAIVVAILRYRLYEIDRLVSRSLGWGLATGAVVALFAVAVLALQAALTHVTQGDAVAVAVSTLLAVAAFQPVRARVQGLVDRRFDRPRLEAERNLAAFGERLQQEVEMNTLVHEVEQTALDTVRPTAAGLWIRAS